MVTQLHRTFALSNSFKEGDLAVGGTRDDRVREDARRTLLGTTVAEIRRALFVDDGVTEAIEKGRDRSFDRELGPLTIRALRDTLLGPQGPAWAQVHREALPSEVVAAVAKVMTNEELSAVALRVFNSMSRLRAPGASAGQGVTIGGAQHFGSRIQPNSPGDGETEILFSILEGLTYGCGDVILGLNPASDDLDTIVRLEQLLERVVGRLELPTRYCVLSDIVKQHHAQARTRVDVGFQSLAGTSTALAGMVGLDVDGLLDLAHGFDGLYFETGQGSAVTNGTAEGMDMVTLEARAYGVARHIQRETGAWTIVNDVAGFIGPEVFSTGAQLERACLEDTAMAKLHGLTMGLDVCATFHMGVAPAELREITRRVVELAAPAYLMAVAGNADPMLGYLTTSFREHPELRRLVGKETTSAMQARVRALGVSHDTPRHRDAEVGTLYAKYAGATADEGRRLLGAVRERGFDLSNRDEDSDARLDAIYDNARRALYAEIDGRVLRDTSPRHVRVRSTAADRDDFLAHPPAGERVRVEDLAAIQRVYPTRRPQVQIVISDGLNANAVNEQLRALLPPLRRMVAEAGRDVGETDVVVRNGRVRAGYVIGQALDVPVVVHILGERPGTGLNTLSAYLTYGRDERGRSRWSPTLDHSCTTAVCGMHPKGKTPDAAAAEIARLIEKMLEQRCSGIALR